MKKMLTVLTLLACAAPAAAQVRPPSLAPQGAPPAAVEIAVQQPAAAEWMAVGGLAAGAVGLIGGGALGYALETGGGCRAVDPFCGFNGTLIGALAGEALLLPLGVHLANGGRGRYLPAATASVGIAALGVLAMATAEYAADGAGQAVVIGIPVAQLISSIAIERRSHRAIR